MTRRAESKYLYLPGCSLGSSVSEFDQALRLSFGVLGAELEELDDWNCCGASAVAAVNRTLSYLLPARNLALAAERGEELVVACNGCYGALRRTETLLRDDASMPLAYRVRAGLLEAGRSVRRLVHVRHVLSVLDEDIGLEAVGAAVVRPLEGLGAASYYGCQFTRPGLGLPNESHPAILERLLEALGATPVDYDPRTECCGGFLMTIKPENALPMIHNLLSVAVGCHANVIVTTCPLCQLNLDAYQQDVNKRYGTDFAVPIVYFSQLLALALGVEPDQLGLDRAFVSAVPLFASLE